MAHMQQMCDLCSKEVATVHLTEIEKGKAKEVHLCEGCAHKKGVVSKSPSPLEILSGMIQQQVSALGEEGKQRCPYCGIKFGEFRAKGRLGCPRDYEVFHSSLEPLIRKLHNGADQHRGTKPVRLQPEVIREIRLREMKMTLDDLIRKERYEEAAKIRDSIRKLEEADAD